MIKSNVGNNIKKYRKQAELSQAEFSKKLGVSRQTISSWEVNRTEPSIGDIEKMCRVLGCTKEQLLKSYREDMVIEEYLQDDKLRELLLCAGGITPKENRDKFIDAFIYNYQMLRGIKQTK